MKSLFFALFLLLVPITALADSGYFLIIVHSAVTCDAKASE